MSEERRGRIQSADPLIRVVARHPTTSFAVVASALVVIKVLVAARLDVGTALGLVSAAGVANVVFGVVILLWPAFLIGVTIGLWLWLVHEARQSKPVWAILAVTSASGVAMFAFLPFIVSAFIVLAGLAEWAYLWWSKKRGREAEPLLDTFGRVLYVVLATGLLFSEAVWLPREIITAGGESYVGYVVEEEGAWTTILRDSDRLLLRVRDATIDSRQICGGGDGGFGLKPADLLDKRPPPLPQCPEGSR